MYKIYQSKLDTMTANLHTNRKYMTETEIAVLEEAIKNYTEFVDCLKRIYAIPSYQKAS